MENETKQNKGCFHWIGTLIGVVILIFIGLTPFTLTLFSKGDHTFLMVIMIIVVIAVIIKMSNTTKVSNPSIDNDGTSQDLGEECDLCNEWFDTSDVNCKEYLENNGNDYDDFVCINICKKCSEITTLVFVDQCHKCEKIFPENDLIKVPEGTGMICKYCEDERTPTRKINQALVAQRLKDAGIEEDL